MGVWLVRAGKHGEREPPSCSVPDDLKAELPLKRILALVQEE
jgi:hypothetical protein